MAIDVTDATFQAEVIERSKTTAVIVDLWAPWCGPCKTIGPILEKLTDATGGRVILAKVNVDENPAISAAFKVQSIPAVYALKDGAMFDGFVGAQSEHVIAEFVQSLMPEGGVPTVESLLAVGETRNVATAVRLSTWYARGIRDTNEVVIHDPSTVLVFPINDCSDCVLVTY